MKMRLATLLGISLAALFLVAGCSNGEEAAPTATPKPPVIAQSTATPVPSPAPTATPVPTPVPTETPLPAEGASPAMMVLGTYSGLDAVSTLGLHGLSGSLEEMTDAGEISSRTAGQVKNTLAVIGAVPWPQDVSHEVTTLQETLEAFRDSLIMGDLEGARAASLEAHEAAHDLSVAAYDWLGAQQGV